MEGIAGALLNSREGFQRVGEDLDPMPAVAELTGQPHESFRLVVNDQDMEDLAHLA